MKCLRGVQLSFKQPKLHHAIKWFDTEGDKMVEDNRFFCPICKSRGFEPSVTGKGCTFCDGTEGGHPPERRQDGRKKT